MKRAKLIFWLIIFGFIALLAYQNLDFFMAKHGLRINLFIVQYHTPEIQTAILLLIFFFAGLLISYFFSLFARFKSKKAINELNASLAMNQQMMEELKKEIHILKGAETSDTKSEPDDSEGKAKDAGVP